VFTFSKTTADLCLALIGCFQRLGGVIGDSDGVVHRENPKTGEWQAETGPSAIRPVK
jgi:hypothetical protein